MQRKKTALVTGSTSGIGRGIAEALAIEGCNSILNGFGDAEDLHYIADLTLPYGRVLHDYKQALS